jgi:4-hydroxy-tetrahydrodipicolinate reductase
MIKVAVWGAGMMGQGLLRYILDRPKDIELVGVIDRHPEKHGMTLGGLLGGVEHDMQITADHDAVLALQPDVVCILTASNLHEITDQVEAAIRAEADVICIAETLVYPWASDAEWADRIDELAREHGVSVLGTGINPGFVLDALPIALSSVCLKIDRIEASRINDLSPFGPTVMLSQGVGTTVEQFEAGIADGSIVGHIGFQESIGLIAYALGWEIAKVEETREPIVSQVERSTPHVHVAPGNVAGCRHIARAYDAAGNLKIELVHPQQIHPELEGVETGDYIRIVGDPTINLSNCPEVPGGKGTYASVGNYIPLIGSAVPGIVTIVDMPLPRFAAPTA